MHHPAFIDVFEPDPKPNMRPSLATSFEPLAPRRILGTADVLDHGEIAQAQNPPNRLLCLSWS
jgi:hypothetical protein